MVPSLKRRAFRGRRRGYILLEVILAVGIFALAGISLVGALNNMGSVFIQSRMELDVRVELEARLTQARIRPLAPMKEKSKPDFRGVSYEKEVSLLDISNDDKIVLTNLYRVTLRASWVEGKEAKLETAEIYIYQP